MTTFGIPDPGGPSGTFAALERVEAPMEFRFAERILPIQVWLIDGEPWFAASVIAAELGYRMASDMTRRLDPDERGTRSVRTPGGPQKVTIISESGLYTAILGSRIPGASEFKRWVTREVLPAIRKTGSYSTAPELSGPELLARAVIEAQAMLAAKDERIAELEPSATAWDRLHELGSDFEVADAAKILSRDPAISIGRDRLFEFMAEREWIFRGRKNRWRAYQDQVDLDRLKLRPGGEYFHKPSGEYRTGDPTILITPKGLAELRGLLGGGGQLALEVAS